MESPNLLIPAIIAFSLLLLGLGLSIYEFRTRKNIGPAPVDHTVKVVTPSPEQRAVQNEGGG